MPPRNISAAGMQIVNAAHIVKLSSCRDGAHARRRRNARETVGDADVLPGMRAVGAVFAGSYNREVAAR